MTRRILGRIEWAKARDHNLEAIERTIAALDQDIADAHKLMAGSIGTPSLATRRPRKYGTPSSWP